MLRLAALAIWPGLVAMVTVELLIVRVPGTWIEPRVPLSVSVPWLTMVPPV